MPTLEDFRQLRAGVPLETQSELITLMSQNPQLMFERIVELAAEKGMTISVEEVKGLETSTNLRNVSFAVDRKFPDEWFR